MVGVEEGDCVTVIVGAADGDAVGPVGAVVEPAVGDKVLGYDGVLVLVTVGSFEGAMVGVVDGEALGEVDGIADGSMVGKLVGCDGSEEGAPEGFLVGFLVGLLEGYFDGRGEIVGAVAQINAHVFEDVHTAPGLQQGNLGPQP